MCRESLEPAVTADPASERASLHSIATSLKRIADVLTPQDGAATCEMVQQVSEMLGDRFPAAQPGDGIRDLRATLRRFGDRPAPAPILVAPEDVRDAGFSTVASNALESYGITKISQLRKMSKLELRRRIPGIGRVYARVIEARCAQFGFALT